MNCSSTREISLQIQGKVVGKIDGALATDFKNGELVKVVIVPGKILNIVHRRKSKTSRIKEFNLNCLGGKWNWIRRTGG